MCQSLALKNPLDPCKEKGAKLSLFLRDEDSDLISGSTGSGGLTTGDDEPSLCCSTDDGPSVCQSKYWKLYCGKFYPFVAQEKDQVV